MRLPAVLAILAPLALVAFSATAVDKPKRTELPPPPAMSPADTAATEAGNDAVPEPEITITTKGNDRHEEYRIGGRLYMIKVIPKHGRPYYLVDHEGHGQFVQSDLMPRVSPPMWVIKRF